MDPCVEAQRVPPTLPHNVRLLGDAVKLLLDANDTASLTVLASRLAPYRIDLKEALVGETLSLQPVLVFEDGYDARSATSGHTFASHQEAQTDVGAQCFPSSIASRTTYTDSTITNMEFPVTSFGDFANHGILSQGAEHACPASGRGLDTDAVFGVAHAPASESLYDGWELFDFETPLNGSDLDCQAARSGSRCHASPEAVMLDDMTHSYRQDGQPGSPSTPTAGNASSMLDTISAAATGRPGLLGQEAMHAQTTPVPARDHEADGTDWKQHKTAKASRFLADATPCKVDVMVQTCLRPDYHQFLKTNLPRWVRDGLWHNEWSQSHGAGGRPGRFENLQRVYSCFCQLDARMRDDAIRGRMVMVLLHLEFESMYHDWKSGRVELAEPVTSMGRGNISAVIDSILEKAHPEWRLADSKQRAAFRAKFHNRKRHGKRWWMLMDALGPSVLLLCSSRFAGAM
ncbi:hypothetical protein E4U42_002837 [Claviceps africana]|uniref:Uncharacterized protein n=1 Tax=Claviceps africana TaxID=83212 RepID=A0A8K0JA47_9HYPO|nr:hypothetical protein E4U42_002837 [Claviceps africana]